MLAFHDEEGSGSELLSSLEVQGESSMQPFLLLVSGTDVTETITVAVACFGIGGMQVVTI